MEPFWWTHTAGGTALAFKPPPNSKLNRTRLWPKSTRAGITALPRPQGRELQPHHTMKALKIAHYTWWCFSERAAGGVRGGAGGRDRARRRQGTTSRLCDGDEPAAARAEPIAGPHAPAGERERDRQTDRDRETHRERQRERERERGTERETEGERGGQLTSHVVAGGTRARGGATRGSSRADARPNQGARGAWAPPNTPSALREIDETMPPWWRRS
jgi:hypothetical protein